MIYKLYLCVFFFSNRYYDELYWKYLFIAQLNKMQMYW